MSTENFNRYIRRDSLRYVADINGLSLETFFSRILSAAERMATRLSSVVSICSIVLEISFHPRNL